MEQIVGYEGKYEIRLTGTPDGEPGVWSCENNLYLSPCIGTNGYRYVRLWDKKEDSRLIHQLVAEHFVNPPDTRHRTVDHINGDKLDNRVQNLRWLTPAEQEINKPANLGYDWKSDHNKYRARIKVDGRNIHLGYFDHPYDAHRAYLDACEKYYPGIRTCLREEIDG